MDRTRDRLDTALLAALAGFTALAVVGYATFGRHPGWLTVLPGELAGVYAGAFGFFAKGQIWLAGAVLGIWLTRRVGAKWIPALLAAYGISLVAELGGTSVGLPFGGYAYAELLGVAWLGKVPVAIPLSWFCMALPSWIIASKAHPHSTVGRIATGSLILLVWDLALDPAMSHATRFWAWADTGPYYGMPLLNLFGWFLTGALIIAAFEALRALAWAKNLPPRWLAAFYGLNVLMPLGMCVAAGLWGAVAMTLAALVAIALHVRRASRALATTQRRSAGHLEPA